MVRFFDELVIMRSVFYGYEFVRFGILFFVFLNFFVVFENLLVSYFGVIG